MMEFHIATTYQRDLTGKNIMFLLAGFPVFYQISLCLLIPYFGLFIIGIALILVDINQQRIVVNQNGIEYYGVGFAVEVEWRNFIKIDTDLLLGEEGLFVSKSLIVAKTQYFSLIKGLEKDFSFHCLVFKKTGATPNLGNKSNNTRHIYLKKKNLHNLHNLWINFRRT